MKKKLLLADDSATIQKVVHLCFADEPFEVRVAPDGDRAQELLSGWCPDILLADVLLPGVDGYELCKRARHKSKIPVVLLVGMFEPFDFGRAEESRYDAYLTKPFDTRYLIELVKELVNRDAEESRQEEAEIAGRVHTLEFEEPYRAAMSGILQIDKFDLTPWDYEIVPQPEPPLPRVSVHEAADTVAAVGASRNLEAHVTAVMERLLPHWMETIHADLLKELRRMS
ncbi:MAG: response regulator [Acidobacteria bacterium]|nr:response regulator [Acidobacteriota bacterium]